MDTAVSRTDRVEKFLKYNSSSWSVLLSNQIRPRQRRPDRYDIKTAASLVRMPDHADPTRYKNRYSHWVQSYLTLLQGLDEYERRTGRKPTLIVEENPPSWIRESLAVHGYDSSDIVYWDGTTELAIDRLVVPSVRRLPRRSSHQTRADTASYKLPSPDACRWLRAHSVKAANQEQFSRRFSNKVLVSRDDASTRRVSNREELTAALKKCGFKQYVLSQLPVPEQVALFSQAEKVVAPHGAGLVNIMFATDCTVIELFGKVVKPTYFLQSESLGLSYCGVLGKDRDGDIHIDVADVVAKVE
jgi:hypothetical protein